MCARLKRVCVSAESGYLNTRYKVNLRTRDYERGLNIRSRYLFTITRFFIFELNNC